MLRESAVLLQTFMQNSEEAGSMMVLQGKSSVAMLVDSYSESPVCDKGSSPIRGQFSRVL